MTMIRHGDVLLRKMSAVDADLHTLPHGMRFYREMPGPNVVLAYGEATGHAHVAQGNVKGFAEQGTGLLTRLQVIDGGSLTHEEHGRVALEPGWYEVVHQRTYSPDEPSWSTRVID